MTEYLTGDDYPTLCAECRATISNVAGFCAELPDDYASDDEGPCMWVYDHRLFCGGHTCVNRPTAGEVS